MKKILLLILIYFIFTSCTQNSFDRQLIDAFSTYNLEFLASYSSGELKERLLGIENMDEKEEVLPESPVVFYSKYRMHPQKWSLVLKDKKTALLKFNIRM
jgi:hypothetical protein